MNTASRRVVVTGLGALTPLGLSADSFWQAIKSNTSAVAPITTFDATQFRAKHAAEIRGFTPSEWLPTHRLKRMDRFIQFAVISSMQAMRDSGLPSAPKPLRDRIGIFCGSALCGFSQAEAKHKVFLEKGAAAIPPSLAMQIFGGSAHSQIAIELGITGFSTTNTNGCAASAVAIGEAWRAIREGLCDAAIAVGAEAPLQPLTFGAFDAINTMAHETYRCFDKRRSGFVMGEGAAALVCESLDHATARGAHIYAEILGYALNNDAYHMSSPRPDLSTISACMDIALASAGVSAKSVDYIHTHGSGTVLNDATETAAIKTVFGQRAYAIPISSTKPAHGHSLGAAGAMETILCCKAIQEQWLPPTLNWGEPDTACDLDCIPNHGRNAPAKVVLKNSFGFGGINSCLVIGKL